MAKVLIIEDDDVIARGMARHLETAGFDAVGVANGETGLARLRYERPDVCVLDLMLPASTAGASSSRLETRASARPSSSSPHGGPSTTAFTRSRSVPTTTS